MNPQHLNYNHNQATFHQEKQKWENAISNYQGQDSLELWYQYICWYEQNIQLDHERLFETILGKCLSIYEAQQHYKQDTRMVKLWMKYIGLKTNPLQLYQVLYQRGIGTQCAIFYVGWAHYYDSANAFKQAESVYNLGFQANAQPYSTLESSHKDFRFSLSQRMLYNDQQSKKRTVSQLNDQRQQLTSLSSSSPNATNFQHAQNNYTPPPPMNQQNGYASPSHQPAHQPTPPPPTQQQPIQNQQPSVLQQQESQQPAPAQQTYENQAPMQPYQDYNSSAEEQQPPAKKFRGPDERTYNRNYNNYPQQQQQQQQQQVQPDYSRKNGDEYSSQYVTANTNSDDISNSTSTACTIALNSVYSGDEDGPDDYGAYNCNNTPTNAAETSNYTEDTLTYSRANISVEPDTLPRGCNLPANFARCAKNHHDPWSWPIFLDEPDTNKVCKYPRHLVYPGNGCEYSLEEIRARNYTKVIETIKERNRQREFAINEQRRLSQIQNEQRIQYESQQQHMQQQAYNQQQEQHLQQQRYENEQLLRQKQYEEQQAMERQRLAEIERQRLAEIERQRVLKEREQSRLAALEMQRAKEEQQRRLAEQQKMQQMQEQAAYAHQQTNRLHAESSPHPPHPVTNHSGYYDQNQSPVYNNYVNYPTTSVHQNNVNAPYQQMQPMQQVQPQQVQQPYYNQSHMTPQTTMHYQPQPQPPQVDHQDMYRQQQNRYPPQTMQQHHPNMMAAAQPQPPPPPMHMQYQDPNYQSQVQYAPQSQPNHAEYQYQMPPATTVPPNSNNHYNVTNQSHETGISVTETKTVNNYADDIEEQIEASTIVLKNGTDKLQKITIKFRKEKTDGDSQPVPQPITKTPKSRKSKKSKSGDKNRSTVKSNLESESENSQFMNDEHFTESNDSFSTPSLSSKLLKTRKSKTKTPKFEPNYLQDDDSCSNSEFTSLYGKYSNEATNESVRNARVTFTGATSTPIRNNNNYQSPCSSAKPSYKSNESSSKSSTPRNTFKSLRRRTSNASLFNSNMNDNDDSMTSFSMVEPNSFFETESNDELHQQRLDKALKTIDTHFKKEHIDPFSSELCKAFLTKANFPSREHSEFYKLSNNLLSKLSNTKMVTIGDTRFNVEKEIGRGAYGNVYRGVNANTTDVVALKFQKPPNTWELYICFEVHQRIKDPNLLLGFMDISSAIIAPNASIFVSEFSQFGSLLDINNRIRQSTTKVMHESLVMHFTSQILNIVHHLHSCKIIHGDIKPDNFLLMKVPNPNSDVPTIRLIDFGCAIDMKFYEPDTQFKKVIQTDGFTCPEMLEGRLWSYETDVFCVAGTVHVMLFGEYMQMVKKFGRYEIKQKLPRYLKKHIWTEFFSEFLNIQDAHSLPNLLKIKEKIDDELLGMESELQSQIRTLSNILYKR